VLGPGNKLISPDYPGSTRKTVEQITGATCFFLQGAAGNVGPVDTFVDDVAVARRLGTCLGLEAAKIYLSLHAVLTEKKLGSIVKSGAALAMYEYVPVDFSELGLGFVSAVLELPTRSPMGVWEKAADRLAEWKTKLAELIGQQAEPDEIAAAQQWVTREQLRTDFGIFFRGKRTIPAESYAIRLGDAAIAVISGEPYSEIGAEVKARSPFPKKTLFAAYEGVHLPYIPTAEVFAFQPPPMEVDHSPFAPEAARIATDHLVNLLITLDRSF
jgi:hypothetical protein